MFVKIDNQDMDALKVEEWIKETRDANGGVISPEFAMEILGKTNHFAHIKKVINLIKKNCSDKNGELVADKVLEYKDFILSAVDRREMSPQALSDLQELAEKGGFKDEFDKTNDKVKIYEVKDCENVDVKIIKSIEEFEALEGEDLRVFFDANEVYLYSIDLKGVEKINFREGAKVGLSHTKNLPKVLDFSMCSKVDFKECNLDKVEKIKFRGVVKVSWEEPYSWPKELDFSMCSKVDLSRCNLLRVEKIKFGEGAEVRLSGGYLPEELDLSMCSYVTLSGCNLSGVESIKFREGATVYLSHTKNLPKVLDFSMCSEVNFYECDLSGVEQIKFREGAIVDLIRSKNWPKKLDFSMCPKVNLISNLIGVEELKFREGAVVDLSSVNYFPKFLDFSKCSVVNLYHCNLSDVETIKFREGAVVDLSYARDLPKELDLSMCSKVNLEYCNLTGVEKIKFKDKEQEKEFIARARYYTFSGKVEYVGDEKSIDLVNGNSGMEM